MKKRIILAVSLVTMAMLSGCGVKANMDISSDGTVKSVGSAYYNEREFETIKISKDFNMNDYKKVKIDGKTFYKDKEETDEYTLDNTDDTDSVKLISDDKVIIPLSLSIDGLNLIGLGYDFIDLTVKVPFKIEYTNAEKLSDNTVRVTDTTLDNVFIAADTNVQNGTNIEIKDTKTGKAIKNNKIYGLSDIYNSKTSKVTSVFAESTDGFLAKAKIYSPKTKEYIKFNPYNGYSLADDLSIVTINNKTSVEAINGKYKVKAELLNGNEKEVTYYIDTIAPTIKVSKNKIQCSDKKNNGYASGIKRIAVNNKIVKNGSKVKKGDTIVVTDKAGNKAKLKVK